MEENLSGHIVGYCGQYLCGSQELWGTKKTLRRGAFARDTTCRSASRPLFLPEQIRNIDLTLVKVDHIINLNHLNLVDAVG